MMAASFCLFYSLMLHIILLSTTQSCTRHDDDTGTCYIDRTEKWHLAHGNISCDPNYPTCIITCSDSQYSCGSEDANISPFIIFPNITQCIINCDSNEACYGSIINVKSCSFSKININGMDQSSMIIYAPDNGGNLFIDLLNQQTSFTNNLILSSPLTSSIIINCQLANSCNKNIINATLLTSTLQYKCHNYCDSTHIYCPSDTSAECMIQCKGSCNNMLIHTQNNVNNLQFLCDEKQCSNTVIQCKINDTLYESQYKAPPCSNSVSAMFLTHDLNVYLYYNISGSVTTKLLHDIFIQTFHIMHQYHNDHIFGDIINITFKILKTKNKFDSKFLAYGILNIFSNINDIEAYEEYVIDIISSDKFLQYYNQYMNMKLFSMNAFQCMAIDINNNIVIMDMDQDMDVDVNMKSNHTQMNEFISVFIIIGIVAGIICTISCGYAIQKHCYKYYSFKIVNKSTQNDEDSNNTNQHQDNIQNQEKKTIEITKTKSPRHWGFTDGHTKYGEVIKEQQEDQEHEYLPSTTPLTLQERNRVPSKSKSSAVTTEEPEPDNYFINRQRSLTLNIKQHPLYHDHHKRNTKLHRHMHMNMNSNKAHLKGMRSLSSVDISELFQSPTRSKTHSHSYVSKEGQFTSTHNNYHIYANTMPVFSLHPQLSIANDALIEISHTSSIEQMDDDLDDYQTVAVDDNDSLVLIVKNENVKNDGTYSDDSLDHCITPMLGAQNVNVVDDNFNNKLSDDTEPELPLSPCNSDTLEESEQETVAIINNIHTSVSSQSSIKYDISSESTKL